MKSETSCGSLEPGLELELGTGFGTPRPFSSSFSALRTRSASLCLASPAFRPCWLTGTPGLAASFPTPLASALCRAVVEMGAELSCPVADLWTAFQRRPDWTALLNDGLHLRALPRRPPPAALCCSGSLCSSLHIGLRSSLRCSLRSSGWQEGDLCISFAAGCLHLLHRLPSLCRSCCRFS